MNPVSSTRQSPASTPADAIDGDPSDVFTRKWGEQRGPWQKSQTPGQTVSDEHVPTKKTTRRMAVAEIRKRCMRSLYGVRAEHSIGHQLS
jgi:hypothetical protein